MSSKHLTPGVRGDLGQYLWDLRTARQMTLREVEEATDVSNAYLSQIETGKVQQPSPHVLHELAEVFGGSYEKMMEIAGHIVPRSNSSKRRAGRLPTFAKEELSQEEEEELLKYLAFIRVRKGGK